MSFGGGDSPQNTTFQTQYTRDAPQVEAAKLGLMQTAQDYTRFGMNPWEAVAPDAKPGETGYGEYEYTGADGQKKENKIEIGNSSNFMLNSGNIFSSNDSKL